MDNVTYPIRALEALRSKVIEELGIGGFIRADQYTRVSNPMSARQFARITYATDLMPHIFDDPSQAANIENVAAVIARNRFELKPHFNEIVSRFRADFGFEEPVWFK